MKPEDMREAYWKLAAACIDLLQTWDAANYPEGLAEAVDGVREALFWKGQS